jgi:hypothetical protein
MDIIFVLLIIAVLAFMILNVCLLLYFYTTNKKIDVLLEKGKIKDFKDILLRQKERNKDLDERIDRAFLHIGDLESLAKKTIQKTSVVRFNPFHEMGGNQSFVIALLDNKNNGFVISSLFVKEGNRVYAKSIKEGRSDHLLSEEEKEAIDKAIKQN